MVYCCYNADLDVLRLALFLCSTDVIESSMFREVALEGSQRLIFLNEKRMRLYIGY